MGEWSKAKEAAQSVLQHYGTLMTRDEWRNGFCHAEYDEVVWGFYQSTESNMGDTGGYSFWYNWPEDSGEPFYNFNNMFVNDKYVELFDEEDG